MFYALCIISTKRLLDKYILLWEDKVGVSAFVTPCYAPASSRS